MLAPLVHRHQVVIAAVADPRIDEMAGGRGDAEAVYDAAAAERARAERRRLAELLGRRGVEVVDSGPTSWPRPWPTATSPSRPPAGSDGSPRSAG